MSQELSDLKDFAKKELLFHQACLTWKQNFNVGIQLPGFFWENVL